MSYGAVRRTGLHVAQLLLAMFEHRHLVVTEDQTLTLDVEVRGRDGTWRERDLDPDHRLDARLRVQVVHVHALFAVDADDLESNWKFVDMRVGQASVTHSRVARWRRCWIN